MSLVKRIPRLGAKAASKKLSCALLCGGLRQRASVCNHITLVRFTWSARRNEQTHQCDD